MQFVPSGRELPHKAEVTRGDCSTTPAAAMRSSPSESETSMTVGAGRPAGTGKRHGPRKSGLNLSNPKESGEAAISGQKPGTANPECPSSAPLQLGSGLNPKTPKDC